MSSGIGRVTFDGIDLTLPPYYAHLAPESEYWWLNAYASEQIVIGPDRLINPPTTVKSWVLPLVIQILPPVGNRDLMLQSMIELASVFHTNSDGYLVLDEFPNSVFFS